MVMSACTGTVFDIRKYSVHDGPGIRTTVFFKGCPLSCLWCHNPEGQSRAPEIMYRQARCIQCDTCKYICHVGAIQRRDGVTSIDTSRCDLCGDCLEECFAGGLEMAGRTVTVSQVMQEIESDIIFYDQSGGGVTFSGGEPLLQPVFLKALLEACRLKGIHTAVDTSGYTSWKTLDALRGMVDLFLYDLKVMDETRHKEYTGVPNRLILQNLRRLSEHGERLIVRMPIIPGLNDQPENIEQSGRFLSSLASLERVDLLAYHKIGLAKYDSLQKGYSLKDTQPPSDERMSELAGLLNTFGLQVKIGA